MDESQERKLLLGINLFRRRSDRAGPSQGRGFCVGSGLGLAHGFLGRGLGP